MEPDYTVNPGPGEAPLSLEFGLIVLGIGALIFVYLVFKLWREYRQRSARREAESDEKSE
ncbi:hypothetical protein FIV42_09425 [Persicimonas caeni]|jgi:hypothetical protein|uniref:Uncharacterized protein n=1 Tax=Persicimonas caeni TaxID=2292766 RepID=A0A4Y6PT44_PERCE|nr:hypothetical protein [Persicimonas caeni]QDG50945.1 hypothetical protein FIV42_09425 [Persicimonas caeni]QED32166.1 hypothetical protein FRD00_09420 [Persicimonas caeni]